MRQKGNLVKRITRSMLTLVWLVGMVSPLTTFGGTQLTGGSGATQSAVPAGKPVNAGATPTPPSKNANGIRVHGHWMIEVRNPDGTLVTHSEFENALVAPPGGAVTLSQLLTGANLVGGWVVNLSATTVGSVEPCISTDAIGKSAPSPCQIVSPGFPPLSATSTTQSFQTLSVASMAGGSLMLAGTATAGQTGSIDTVSSSVIYCPLPSPCTNTTTGKTFGGFTSAVVSPAISVTVGQSIAVNVTITFS